MKRCVVYLIVSASIWLIACESDKRPLAKVTRKPKQVGIQAFAGVHNEYIEAVKSALEKYYHFRVRLLSVKSLPENTTNKAVAGKYKIDLPLRYRADSLLGFLRKIRPPDCDYVIGITHQDITCSNRDRNNQIQFPVWLNADWGIFGLGSCPGRTCIVSVYRLGLDGVEATKIQARVAKVAKHEIGHNLGLPHCVNAGCLMRQINLENALASLDAEKQTLCEACKRKIGLE
jgi:archaemetzincin